MKLILEFDFDADVIEVPQCVLENREILQKKILEMAVQQANQT